MNFYPGSGTNLQLIGISRHRTRGKAALVCPLPATRFPMRTHSLLQLSLTDFLQHAVPAAAISQIASDGLFLLRNIPALVLPLWCKPSSLPVSLLYLCFEHVDNLGAYTASRPETGLLVPPDFTTLINPAVETAK